MYGYVVALNILDTSIYAKEDRSVIAEVCRPKNIWEGALTYIVSNQAENCVASFSWDM